MPTLRPLLLSCLIGALALTTSTPPSAAAPQADGAFPFEVHAKTLDNGLRIYAIPTDSPGIIAYTTVVSVGSRDEVRKGRTGFAHFFEHMMFRGTQANPADVYNNTLKRLGVDSNAWTWDDQTTYWLVSGAAGLDTIMELEADRFEHLEYDKASFQKESRAVLGEYNKNAANPARKLTEVLRAAAFDVHTYKHTTMGFIADIEAMPEAFDYAHDFFALYYTPTRCAVVVTGDVDPAALFENAERLYGDWRAADATPEGPIVPEPPQNAERRVSHPWPAPTAPRVLIGWKKPAFTQDLTASAALDVIADLVFAERSPLYQKLVIGSQIATSLSAQNAQKRDPHLFQVLATTNAPEALEKVEAEIYAALDTVATQGVDDATLAQVLKHKRYGFMAELDTPAGVNSAASWMLSVTGDIGTIDAYFDAMSKLTSQDIMAVAKAVFRPEKRTVVTLTVPAAPDADANADAKETK